MLRPWNAKEDVRYYNYIFQTTMFQRSLFGLGNGILIKESGNGKLNTIRMRIPMDKFGGLFIPVAPTGEQHRIADFLDAKCAEIDVLTTDIQTQIDTLEQYKRSVITETVTKGLNPDAEMKDSGIQWIGNMPSHWEVIRGKYILRYMQKPVRDDDGVITCFRDGEVTLRSNRREDGFTMSDKEIGYQGIDIGDLVVHGMDGFAGAIGISDSRGKASPVLNVLDTNQNKRYIMYYLRSMAYSDVTDSGDYRLASFVDEQRMCRLYEKFILEYYSRHYPELSVSASQIPWSLDDGIGTMLPVMQSDIHLQRGNTVLIIDAKYYSHTTQSQFDKHTIHSNNLYQIFTYVKNRSYQFGEEKNTVSGMLLYAKTEEEIQPDNVYQMHGSQISVKTLDLNQPFAEIANQMDRIVESHFSGLAKKY